MSCTANFNLADLTNIINIIDVCTQRGAFRALELEGIGALYTKLRASHLRLSPKLSSKKAESVAESVAEPAAESVAEPAAEPAAVEKPVDDNECCESVECCKSYKCEN